MNLEQSSMYWLLRVVEGLEQQPRRGLRKILKKVRQISGQIFRVHW